MATLLVDCPHCSWTLEVDKDTGQVVNKWETRPKDGKDPMAAALERLKAEKEARDSFFEVSKAEAEERKRKAEEMFEREKERLKREGKVERPPNPFDLD